MLHCASRSCVWRDVIRRKCTDIKASVLPLVKILVRESNIQTPISIFDFDLGCLAKICSDICRGFNSIRNMYSESNSIFCSLRRKEKNIEGIEIEKIPRKIIVIVLHSKKKKIKTISFY